MTHTSVNVVQTGSMPPQKIPPMPVGATSPMNAGIIKQQQQINQQMALIGKSGGSTKRHLIGGTASPVVQVPPVTGGPQNVEAITQITGVAQKIQGDAVFDKSQNAGDTAIIASKQQALYKTGGSKCPIWGCLSGGKKSRRKGRKGRKGMRGRNGCKCKKIKKGTKKHYH